jgi:hypothetical protein
LPPFVCLPPAVLAGEVVRSEMISSDRLNNSTGGDDLTHDFSQNPEGELLWEHSTSAKASIDLSSSFPGEAGDWRIVIDYEDAKGRRAQSIRLATHSVTNVA